jgi:hypothetical protein
MSVNSRNEGSTTIGQSEKEREGRVSVYEEAPASAVVPVRVRNPLDDVAGIICESLPDRSI